MKKTTKSTKPTSSDQITTEEERNAVLAEVNDIIAQATTVYNETTAVVDGQIDRIEKALLVIREAHVKDNVPIPEKLNKYINDVNKFKQLQGRMKRHLDMVRDESAPIEKRLAIVTSMIELSNNIPEINIIDPSEIVNVESN